MSFRGAMIGRSSKIFLRAVQIGARSFAPGSMLMPT